MARVRFGYAKQHHVCRNISEVERAQHYPQQEAMLGDTKDAKAGVIDQCNTHCKYLII